jgi:hypothetical protein
MADGIRHPGAIGLGLRAPGFAWFRPLGAPFGIWETRALAPADWLASPRASAVANAICDVIYCIYIEVRGCGLLGRRERSELRAAKPLAQHAVSNLPAGITPAAKSPLNASQSC